MSDGRYSDTTPLEVLIRVLVGDYRKFLNMTDDMHLLAVALNDMRYCFITLTVLVCAGSAGYAIYFLCTACNKKPASSSEILRNSFPLPVSMSRKGSIQTFDGLQRPDLSPEYGYRGNWFLNGEPGLRRTTESVFFDPNDMRYHRKHSQRPDASPRAIPSPSLENRDRDPELGY